MDRLLNTSDFIAWHKQLMAEVDSDIPVVMLCGGTGCTALGSTEVYDAFEQEIKRLGLGEKVRLKRTGCHGFCEKGPVVVILPDRFSIPAYNPKM